jgi:hypothetical protein
MKSTRQPRPIKPIGRSPVVAIRVPAPLHARITAEAKRAGMSMSEFMAGQLWRSFEWQDAFNDRVAMLKEAAAESKRVIAGNLEAEMRRQGWSRLHGTEYWLPPGMVPRSGFIAGEPEHEQAQHLEDLMTRAVGKALAAAGRK